MTQNQFDVRQLGAAGDGQADDTAAFQKALDAAGENRGVVFVPPGNYRVGKLKMHSFSTLRADATWTHHTGGGPVLRLIDNQADCLLDCTAAIGITINGLCFEADMTRQEQDAPARRGRAHGIMFNNPGQSPQEDWPKIENCRVAGFFGDGIHMKHIWCWSVRHCQSFGNGGHGMYVEGFDGYLLDSWLSGNGGAGFRTEDCGACHTITHNRIEWNRQGGIILDGCKHCQITGNFIDRAGGPGIRLGSTGRRTSEVFAITGNVIWRSGRPEWTSQEGYNSSQCLLEDTWGLSMVGNSFNVWRDDGPRGQFSPRYGIVYRHLESCIIKDNAMHGGALEKLIVDLGGHGPGVIVADNPGTLFDPTGR